MMWQDENDPHAGMKAAGLHTEESDFDYGNDPLRDMALDELHRLRVRLVHEASAVASRPGLSFPVSDDWGADFIEYNDIHRRINECEAALHKLGRTP